MEKKFCPHCGTQWLLEEHNYTLFRDISSYKFDKNSVTLETTAKRILSNFTHKCVSCGYHINNEITY